MRGVPSSEVTTVELSPKPTGMEPLVAAATAGDERAFATLVDRYRRELQVHAYRILGSWEDSEDLAQETFLRAWRMRETFQGRSSFRAWLYRIATNASLNALQRHSRRFEVATASIEPVLEAVEAAAGDPEDDAVAAESTELAFLVVVRQLPPRQRAVLFLRDLLHWSAKDTAELLDTSVAAVNSALQRARETLRSHLLEHDFEWAPGSSPNEEERGLLDRYLEAAEKAEPEAFAVLLREET